MPTSITIVLMNVKLSPYVRHRLQADRHLGCVRTNFPGGTSEQRRSLTQHLGRHTARCRLCRERLPNSLVTDNLCNSCRADILDFGTPEQRTEYNLNQWRV